jgi:DNA polymerase sigma
MNPQWLQTPLGSTYQDMHTQPKNQYTIMPHPGENSFMVNKYFLPLNDDALLNNLRRHLNHHEQNHRSLGKPLVGRILASFFYYYAYEFDYKKDVVSLQSHRHGIVERGAKGENDGWKTFGQSLCIEDPFETFYDVAHVLKPSSFQRVKREFALAYSKIADSFVTVNSNDDVNIFGHDLLDRLCEVDQN